MATPAINKSNILVTGSRGYIGTLLSEKVSCLSIDFQNSGPDHFRSLDYFDAGASDFSEVEIVVHLADRRLQEINGQNLFQNIELHRTFLKKLNDLPRLKKVIWASSCSVYGYSEQEIHEASRVNPTSFYAESKLAVEAIIQDYALPSLILRFGTAHGWSPSMRQDLFVNQLVQAVSGGEEIEIYSPEAWRPYIHCRDFANRIQLEILGERVGIWNVVTENFRKSDILSLPCLLEKNPKFRVKNEEDPRNYRVRLSGPCEGFIDMSQSISEMMKRLEYAKIELAQLKERGYEFSDPFEVVEIFERKVSEHVGANYGIAVDCCTHAVELCLRYLGAVGAVQVPKRTYVSIPMTILKLNCKIEWTESSWTGRYQLAPYPVVDASLDFRADSHIDGTFTCLSFHLKKSLPIGRGGMILTNDHKAADWLRKASYDGRTRGTLWKEDAIEILGYHYYMTPEDAARGLLLLDSGHLQHCRGSDLDYPDLSLLKVFQEHNDSN